MIDENKIKEWKRVNKKFSSMVYDNRDYDIPKVTLAMEEYRKKATIAYEGKDFEKVEYNMSKFMEIATQYISEKEESSPWKKEINLPSQAKKAGRINLCTELSYAQSGVGITRLLNTKKSPLVKHKPYTNLNKTEAIQILKELCPLNRLANITIRKIESIKEWQYENH